MKGIVQIGLCLVAMFFTFQLEAQTSVFNWDVENPYYIQPVDAASFSITDSTSADAEVQAITPVRIIADMKNIAFIYGTSTKSIIFLTISA